MSRGPRRLLLGALAAAVSLVAFAGLAAGTEPNDTYQEAVAADSPVDQYRFDDSPESSSLADSAGSDTASLADVTLGGSGPFAGSEAGEFDGAGYASLATNPLAGDSAFTIEAWGNWSGTSTAYGQPILDLSAGSTTYMSLTPASTASGHPLTFEIAHAGTGYLVSAPELEANRWSDIAVTESGETLALYVNGEKVASKTGVAANPSTLGALEHDYFGKPHGGSEPELEGSLSNISFYGTALSEEQIKAHYHAAQLPAPSSSRPTIEGVADAGQSLHASPGELGETIDESKLDFKWQRCDEHGESCEDLSGATHTEYEVQGADVGGTLRVVVSHEEGTETTSETSDQTAVVGPAPTLLDQTAPAVSGETQEGRTLTAEHGTWLGEGTITYSYQWQRCDQEGADCADIPVAKSSTYTLRTGDIGQRPRVLVTAHDADGDASVSSAPAQLISAAASPVSSETPAISGTMQEGQTLEVSVGGWEAEGTPSYSYQWERCETDGTNCQALAGATSHAYTPVEADVGSTLRAIVIASIGGSEGSAVTDPTEEVNPATLENTAAPTISGDLHVAHTLTGTTGSWSASGALTYSYQWQRCGSTGGGCSNISGATSSTYTTVSGDIAHRVRLLVHAESQWGLATAPSEPTTGAIEPAAPANETAPSIEGEDSTSSELEAQPGSWSGGAPITYGYRWKRCDEGGGECTPIEGATSNLYPATSADAGHTLVVEVTATSPWGESSAASAATSPIVAPAPVNSEEPWIFGGATQGELLVAEPGSWISSVSLTYSYQWRRCNAEHLDCTDIAGATEAIYLVGEADVESTLEVIVTAHGDGGEASASAELWGAVQGAASSSGSPTRVKEAWVQGEGLVGETLTIHPGEWAGEPPISFSYQWQRCNGSHEECTDIEGATGTTYTLSEADLGHSIQVRLTATNGLGEAGETAWLYGGSIEELEPHGGPPVNVTESWIAGEPVIGATLTVHPGSWNGQEPIAFGYQWRRCNDEYEECTDIEGATGTTFTLSETDLGHRLQAVVSATNEAGESPYVAWLEGAPEEILPQEGAPENRDEPQLHGEPVVGETEIISQPGVWAGEAPITIAYQWKRCNAEYKECADIEGATGATYEATLADVGHPLQVLVSASNGSGEASSVGWLYGGPVVPVGAPRNARGPSVHGEQLVGEAQTASPGAWRAPSAVTYSYQWQRCAGFFEEECSNIGGATEAEYTPVTADVGYRLQVIVTAHDEAGEATALGYDFGGAISEAGAGAKTPTNLSAPEVHGNVEIGALLTAWKGRWAGEQPIGYSYQWQRCDPKHEACEDIPGATGNTYQTTSDDGGHTLQVLVTATNDTGEGTETGWLYGGALPLPGALVNTSAPSASGERAVGATATVDPGEWEGTEPITFAYQWDRCNASWEECEAIPGATGANYTIGAEDEGHKLQVEVKASNPVNEATSTASLFGEIGPPQATEPILEEPPAVSGEALDGHTLTASEGQWTGPTSISYAYQWQRCNSAGESCVDIAGAHTAEYTLGSADLGSTVRVMVTATHATNSVESPSASTGTVTAGPPVGERPLIGNAQYPGETIEVLSATARGAGPITATYQWQLCNPGETEECTDVEEATASSLTPTETAVGKRPRVVVTYHNEHGTDVEASWTDSTIADHAPINRGAPSFEVPETGLGDGETVTAAPGTWAGSEPISYAYQWQKCVHESCSNIEGATEPSSTVSLGEGSLRVKVTASNSEGTAIAYSTSSPVYPPAGAPVLVHAPVVTGEPLQGETLHVSNGAWHNSPTEFTYVWEQCRFVPEVCTTIPEATGSSYTATIDQAPEYLEVKVTASSSSGSASTTTRPVGPVRATPPLNTEAPAISGEPIVGNEMSASTGSWTNNTSLSFSEGNYEYRWELCNGAGESCKAIEGNESRHSLYTPPSGDVGSTLRVTVQTNSPDGENVVSAHSEPTSVLSAAEAVANSSAPAISGTVRDGDTLTGTSGSWSGSPAIHYSYQWEGCDAEGASCEPLEGATEPEHTLKREEVGATVRLKVTATNGAGSATSYSAVTEPVKAAAAPTNLTPPEFSVFYESWTGEPEHTVASEISATPGTWTGDPTITYEWERCDASEPGEPVCHAISEATSQTYRIRPADVGYELRLTEIATNPAGSATARTEATKHTVQAPEINYELTPGSTVEQHRGGNYSGAAVVGQTITAQSTASSSYELPLTTTYEFQRVNEEHEDTVLQTGSDPEYTITPEDLGHEIAIMMTIEEWRADKAIVLESLTITASTHTVEEGPANDSLPAISGELIAGKTLTASSGTWHGGAGVLSYAYQWQRCNSEGEGCEPIEGATSATYDSVKQDTGHSLRVQVTASNQGADASATSIATSEIAAAEATVNTGPPAIEGEAVDQQPLTATHGTWSGTTPISYAYQWLTCNAEAEGCEPIEGATTASYTLHAGQVGATLRVQVTASNAAGSVTATSAATELISAVSRPVNLALPSVVMLGFEQPGTMVVAEPGTWENLTGAELQTLHYQWERCNELTDECEDIEGAMNASTIVTSADVGRRLRVAVIAENESGRTAAISEPTALVNGLEGEEPPAEPPSREQEEEEAPEGEVAGHAEEIVYSTPEDLYAATLEGGSPERLTDCHDLSEQLSTSVCQLAHPVISSDNTTIAVEVSAGSTHRIVLMNSHGGSARFLPGEAESPALTPNARMITYTRPASPTNGQPGPQLFTMTLGESPEPVAVATGMALSEHAAYSPDGTALAFLGKQHAEEPWHLYIAEANGEEPEELAVGGLSDIADPVFSSDSKYVYMAAAPAPPPFSPEEHGETPPNIRGIVKIPVEGGSPQTVSLNTGHRYSEVREPTPLPNDKLAASVSSIVVFSYGFGISVQRNPPTLALFSTLTGEAESSVAEPPDHGPLTGVTARLKGPHARTAYLQACRLPHKVCGTWNHVNTEEANYYAELFAETYNDESYFRFASDDCTDYVSQLLHESGMKMLGAFQEVSYAWWAKKPVKDTVAGRRIENLISPDDTQTWSTAEKLYHELRDTGLARPLEYGEKVQAGDILFFNWYPESPRINHAGMVVTGNNSDPAHEMYTQHTPNRYWSLKREEREVTEYLHEEFKIKESEGARGVHWQWYPLKPVHLGAIIPPE